ncbi:MAG: MAPEG family protein [Pseudomonadota bacterium]
MHSEILKPVVVLVAWSLVMLVWMVATRLPALKKLGVDMSKVRGSKPGQLDGLVPDKTQWPAHNYNHLMEQPTIFYAVALVIALTGTGDGMNAWIAWGYVGLRIVHSLWHSTVNQINIRFLIFAASSLCLMALTLHAVIAVFQVHG